MTLDKATKGTLPKDAKTVFPTNVTRTGHLPEKGLDIELSTFTKTDSK